MSKFGVPSFLFLEEAVNDGNKEMAISVAMVEAASKRITLGSLYKTVWAILRREPELALCSKIYNAIGGLCEGKKDYHTALSYYNETLRRDPDNLDALHGAVKALKAQGHYAGTLPFYQKFLSMYPVDPRYYVGLAQAYFGCGEYGKTLACYNTLLQLNPITAEIEKDLGAVCKKIEEAAYGIISHTVESFANRFYCHASLHKSSIRNDFSLFVFQQFNSENFNAQALDLEGILEGKLGFSHITHSLVEGIERYGEDSLTLDVIKEDIALIYRAYKGENLSYRINMVKDLSQMLKIPEERLWDMPQVSQENVTVLFEKAFQGVVNSLTADNIGGWRAMIGEERIATSLKPKRSYNV